MKDQTPFESIESAHEFIVLLEEAIATARSGVQEDLDSARSQRQEVLLQALTLADLKMGQLSSHVQKSRRLLNDLRLIRVLLLNERTMSRSSSS